MGVYSEIQAKKRENRLNQIAKYQLESPNSKYVEEVSGIAQDLGGLDLLEHVRYGMPEVCNTTLLSAIARQNFVIIQLLNEIAQK